MNSAPSAPAATREATAQVTVAVLGCAPTSAPGLQEGLIRLVPGASWAVITDVNTSTVDIAVCDHVSAVASLHSGARRRGLIPDAAAER